MTLWNCSLPRFAEASLRMTLRNGWHISAGYSEPEMTSFTGFCLGLAAKPGRHIRPHPGSSRILRTKEHEDTWGCLRPLENTRGSLRARAATKPPGPRFPTYPILTITWGTSSLMLWPCRVRITGWFSEVGNLGEQENLVLALKPPPKSGVSPGLLNFPSIGKWLKGEIILCWAQVSQHPRGLNF